MKSLILFLLFTFFSESIYCQGVSPGLDVLIDSSKVIVQGVILKKYCRPSMDIHSSVSENCVCTMNVENIIKGAALLSILEIQTIMTSEPKGTTTRYDTVSGLCFEHKRMRIPFYTDSLNRKPDYNALVGDNVIVFLGRHDPDPYRQIVIPDGWIVYELIDRFLGVITANDYVIEYIKNRIKAK